MIFHTWGIQTWWNYTHGSQGPGDATRKKSPAHMTQHQRERQAMKMYILYIHGIRIQWNFFFLSELNPNESFP